MTPPAVTTALTTDEKTRATWTAHTETCKPCRTGHACRKGETLRHATVQASADAWDALHTYLPPGSTVTYQGRLTTHHGPGWTVIAVAPTPIGPRYVLVRDTERLTQVSVESVVVESRAST